MTTEPNPVRVLLVDDEKEFLDSTARILERRGFVVRTAVSAPEALARFGEEPVDVAVFDVKMPGMDGYELFRRVRETWPEVPIVMLTGHGTIGKAFELSRAGVFDYLAKPVDVNRLAAVLLAAAGRAPRPAPRLDDDAPSGIRVLIVDDEREFLASLAKVLSRRGMEVITAQTGEEGLALLSGECPDVAVVDIRMPGMGGLRLLSMVRELDDPAEVILLTGHASEESLEAGRKEGAFAYLTKPQDVDELAERIRSAAERCRRRRAARIR